MLVGAPYREVIRLVLFAGAYWDHLEAQNPTVDLLALPFRKLLSMLYIANADVWAAGERESRGAADSAPTFAEFDALLNAPLPGEVLERQTDPTEFLDDYRALMGE